MQRQVNQDMLEMAVYLKERIVSIKAVPKKGARRLARRMSRLQRRLIRAARGEAKFN